MEGTGKWTGRTRKGAGDTRQQEGKGSITCESMRFCWSHIHVRSRLGVMVSEFEEKDL